MAHINSIFNFLKEYNEISNPVITEIDKQKWSLELSELPQINELWSVYHTQDLDSQKILEIIKPILEPCPIPDSQIVDWLIGYWKNSNIENISYKEFIETDIENQNGEIETLKEFFDDVQDRVNLFNAWTIKRNKWRAVELPKEQGLELYNNLFKLYSDMKKESESVELILGDGHIYWKTLERTIDHPSILQRVQLYFDPEKPSFTIKFDELKAEVYTPMLRVVPSINQAMLSDIIQELETSIVHIADIKNNKGFFQRLINVLDEKGKLVDEYEKTYSGPMIKFSPVLFLRKRTLGFSMFINKILEDIENNPDTVLPDFFDNLIGNHREHEEPLIVDDNWNESGIDQDVLLTLHANNEQLKIIKFLDNYGAVLVQGPPGTGKTHTIANLIGHLLSQGLSVLVTSHTEKALSVLKEKVYKDPYNHDVNLQSLCISLLSSNSQKKEMDDAINEIAIKGTQLDLNESKKKIEKLETERSYLIARSKEKSRELLQIRGLEYKDIVYDNSTISPIEAAKFINAGLNSLDFIPGSTSDDTIALPISIEDLKFLYSTNESLSLQEEELLVKNPPEIILIWSPEKFKTNVEKFLKYKNEINEWKPKLIINESVSEENVRSFLDCADRTLLELKNMETFQSSILNKSLNDSLYITLWNDIFKELDDLMQGYEKYRKVIFNNEYEINDNIKNNESFIVICEIVESGKDIPVNFLSTVTKPKWKKIKECITNHGKVIEKRGDFENVKFIIEYELDRLKLIKKINKLFEEAGETVSVSDSSFEEKTRQLRSKVEYALSWYDNAWTYLHKNILGICVNKEEVIQYGNLIAEDSVHRSKQILEEIICHDLKKYFSAIQLKKLEVEWFSYSDFSREYSNYDSLFKELHLSINEKNIERYIDSYQQISNILEKSSIYSKKINLINDLKKYAPEWAKAIMLREGVHGSSCLPENIELAWKWRQLSNQIQRIDSYDANQIQKEIAKLNEQLLQNARKLAYEKAWFEKIKNKTVAQTQAIEGWRTTIKQVGKGTGKTAPALLQKARELMPLCQSAIPVWIMPLNRVAENFDPRKNKFDIVIIDEASQADILALSALYLGKKVIIVGDDEQVSPDSVGIKTDEINALIEQYLSDIPNNQLFNGKTSVYDMAKTAGFKPMMLIEHFRCLPEIIQFSNELSYNGKVKALRDASRVKIKPSVVEHRVPNAFKTVRKTNESEAEHIASLVCACVDDPIYNGKTIGIISLLGQEQANEIDRLIQANIDPKEYEKRKIQCGTAAQFQGDERDIIFISIVEGPNEKGGPVRLLSEDGNNDANRKKYNVAASRARDQMWVVHSLNPEIDLKPDDIRLKLIRHAINPAITINAENIKKTESDFEKQVLGSLSNKGYKVIPQWKVGAYRIDMVVEDGDKRIAIECDGEKWHTQDDLPNDLRRQAILERLGWKFIRIRGSAFYRFPEATMEWVYKELESYGVNPNYSIDEIDNDEKNQKSNEIIDCIKRSAEQIRREWNSDFNEDSKESETRTIGDTEFIEVERIPKVEIHEDCKLPNHEIEVNGNLDCDLIQSDGLESLRKKDLFNGQLSLEIPELVGTNLQMSLEEVLIDKGYGLNQSNVFDDTHIVKKAFEQFRIDTNSEIVEIKDKDAFDIVVAIKNKGYKLIDNRSKGGALWVYGEQEIGEELKMFSGLGFHFEYAPNGGRATGHKPAWFTK